MTKGGPWALLLILLVALVFLKIKGVILTEGEVDRIIGGYRENAALYRQQLDHKETANQAQAATIAKQAEQIERLMEHSAVSAHALGSILEEARKRGMA